jgi:hypothetical protein
LVSASAAPGCDPTSQYLVGNSRTARGRRKEASEAGRERGDPRRSDTEISRRCPSLEFELRSAY